MLTDAEIRATADSIADWQLDSGMILWFPGGHCDPWNHVEAAMALTVGGRGADAERAYEWLASTQHDDGSWFNYYLADGVEDYRLDTNVTAYVAVGVWHHFLATGDPAFLERMWPVVDKAMGFVLRLQQPGGQILWSIEPDGITPGRFALLTGSSSVLHSLRAGVAIAERLRRERPEWELAAGQLAHAIAHRRLELFEPKDRWAMDWYYPVLSGALHGADARAHLQDRWDEFVMEGLGVRCVADRPWATAAETAECAIACAISGMKAEAARLLRFTRHMRAEDGSYFTGCVHPQCVRYPGDERTTYTAAAIVLADDLLKGGAATTGVFAGHALPAVVDLPEAVREP
ncbi:MAG: hypothetical protein QOE35_414 [Actinomycetota bacterium]|jgi:hypothetical protein